MSRSLIQYFGKLCCALWNSLSWVSVSILFATYFMKFTSIDHLFAIGETIGLSFVYGLFSYSENNNDSIIRMNESRNRLKLGSKYSD